MSRSDRGGLPRLARCSHTDESGPSPPLPSASPPAVRGERGERQQADFFCSLLRHHPTHDLVRQLHPHVQILDRHVLVTPVEARRLHPSVIPAQAGIHPSTPAPFALRMPVGPPTPLSQHAARPHRRPPPPPFRHSCAGRNPRGHPSPIRAPNARRPSNPPGAGAPPACTDARRLHPSVIPAQAGIHPSTPAPFALRMPVGPPTPLSQHAARPHRRPPPPPFPSFLRRQESMRPPQPHSRSECPTALQPP